MMVDHTAKDIDKLLEQAERADMEAYCKEQGFSQSETETFIQNSLNAKKSHSFTL